MYVTKSFQNGADVNARNGMGDTSLHRAAFTGRAVSLLCIISIVEYFVSFLFCFHLPN